MPDELYDQLADIFNLIGFGSRKSPELANLLKALFKEEEARLALHLSPMAPEPPARLAERIGADPDRVAKVLNDMADRGLIYSTVKNGENWYKLIQLVPGIFELQFMKGEFTPRAKELARLFDAYFHAQRAGLTETAPTGEAIHFARVIPIEKTVTPTITVFPFETAGKYIQEAQIITVSTCYCRHEKRLLGHGCSYPDDVCLQLGPFAEFVKTRGFGREIRKEEAMAILHRSAEAGLIHTSSNTQERIDFICNCCTCCCGILQGVSQFNAPVRTVSSNYQAAVAATQCTGCGECSERCQMKAVTLEDEVAVVQPDRCVGCGVCVYHCPSGAMTLVPRSEFVTPPRTFRELIAKQAEAKSRS